MNKSKKKQKTNESKIDFFPEIIQILNIFSISVPQIPQFPAGFQGTSLAHFAGNTGNFSTFRPQFSVPGQSTGQSNFNATQVIIPYRSH